MKDFYIRTNKLVTLGPTVYYMLVNRCGEDCAESFDMMSRYRYVQFCFESNDVNYTDQIEDLIGTEEATVCQILEYLGIGNVTEDIFFGIGHYLENQTIVALGKTRYNVFRQILKRKYGYFVRVCYGSYDNMIELGQKYIVVLDSDLDLVFRADIPSGYIPVSLEEILEFIEENRGQTESNVLHNDTTIQEINETIKTLENNVRDAQEKLDQYLKTMKSSIKSVKWSE